MEHPRIAPSPRHARAPLVGKSFEILVLTILAEVGQRAKDFQSCVHLQVVPPFAFEVELV